MGRKRRPKAHLLLVLGLAALSSGCGAMIQAGYGFSEEQTRTTTRVKQVRLEGVPAGAVVERHGPDGVTRLADPTRDEVSYAVTETVQVPRSRVPMYIGTAIDAVGLGASIYAASRSEDHRIWGFYSAFYFGIGMVADGVFAAIYSTGQKEEVVGYAPVGDAPVRYVVKYGAHTREQDLELAWADRVVFDFDTAPDASSPGGPRLGALAPPLPPAPEAAPAVTDVSGPPPDPEERWYGWQILPLDILSITGFVLGAAKGDRALIWGSVGLFVAGPPVVHLANDQIARAGGSIAVRGLGPLAGGAVGFILGLFAIPFIDCGDGGDFAGYCVLAGPVIGTAIGAGAVAVAAPFLDTGFLAWKPVEPDDASETAFTIVPSTGRTDDGQPTFGLAGRF